MFFAIFLSFFALTSAIVDQLGVDQCSCRVKASKKIVGGKETEAHGYPWQISINDDIGLHICSGVIVNSQWVLTSWKCIADKSPSDIYLRLAVHKLSDLDNAGLTFKVEKVESKPMQQLALLKLTDPIFFTKGLIEPACFNDEYIEDYKDNLIATGWGATEKTIENEFIGSFSDVLREGLFKEDKEEECRSDLLCVKEAKKGDSICDGDQGGPIHYTQNGRTTVEAILSRVPSQMIKKENTFCLGKGVFSRVVRNIDWIEQNTGKDHC